MSRLPETVLLSFRAELTKQADMMGSVSKVLNPARLRNIGSMAGAGALTGGALGTAIGGVKGYRDARQEGGSVGQSLMAGAGGGVKGLVRGAGVGAGVGAAGGALARGNVAEHLSNAPGALGSFSRFGERQVHGFTGHLTPQELEHVRGGAFDAKENLGKAFHAHEAVRGKFNATPGELAHSAKELDTARTVAGAAGDAQERGLTSLPGIAKGMKKDPMGTLRSAAGQQWHGESMGGKALMLGMPAVGLASAAAAPETREGAGKGEQVGAQVGSLAGGVLGAPLPLIAQGALQAAGDKAGKTIGKGVDYLRGRRKPAYSASEIPNVQENQRTPIEHVTSPAAAGKPGMDMQ